MNFAKLWNTVESYVDPVADFLLGEKEYESGDVVGPRSGGFLDDILGKGAKMAYESMKDEDPDFAATEHKAPKITRYRPAPPSSPGGATAMRGPIGSTDPRVQKLLQNARRGRVYANPDMNAFGKNVRVAMNLRQGRRTQGLERAAVPSVKEAAPAAVRKHKNEVV